jgi:hypothetical protein
MLRFTEIGQATTTILMIEREAKTDVLMPPFYQNHPDKYFSNGSHAQFT